MVSEELQLQNGGFQCPDGRFEFLFLSLFSLFTGSGHHLPF